MMSDKLFFYSKSSDKVPGKGTNEYVKNVNDYKELSKIKDWRKHLSNFYVSPFRLDGEEWNSLEHWYHAAKFRDYKKPGPNYNYYKTFTTNGGKSWSLGGGDDAWYAGQAGKPRKSGKIDRKSKKGEKLPENVSMIKDFTLLSDKTDSIARKAMTLGFLAKFTQNPLLKKILLETKDAELWHVVSRRGHVLWDHLMTVRECIRKYDGIYDLSIVSQLPENIVSDIFRNYD
jgi:predicted NAD-dependent protein-ADP-ribosyltransferase YbiA (DUF1768 family)